MGQLAVGEKEEKSNKMSAGAANDGIQEVGPVVLKKPKGQFSPFFDSNKDAEVYDFEQIPDWLIPTVTAFFYKVKEFFLFLQRRAVAVFTRRVQRSRMFWRNR